MYEELQTLNRVINKLKNNPLMEQDEFIQIMTDAFDYADYRVQYEFAPWRNAHYIYCHYKVDLELEIKWTFADEVADDLDMFFRMVLEISPFAKKMWTREHAQD